MSLFQNWITNVLHCESDVVNSTSFKIRLDFLHVKYNFLTFSVRCSWQHAMDLLERPEILHMNTGHFKSGSRAHLMCAYSGYKHEFYATHLVTIHFKKRSSSKV